MNANKKARELTKEKTKLKFLLALVQQSSTVPAEIKQALAGVESLISEQLNADAAKKELSVL